jgi:hypothetical protein
MTVLEKAVGNLAAALETLESKLEDRLDLHGADREAVEAAQRQAQTARKHTAEANQGLSAAISDIKALLDANDIDGKE